MGRINFQIDEEKKEQVKAHVEDSAEFESLSQFLRIAAIRAMKDENEGQTEVSRQLLNRLTEVENQLEELQHSIKNIDAQLDGRKPDINTLSEMVFETLPEVPAPSSAEVQASNRSAEELETQLAMNIIERESPTTIKELAWELEVPEQDVIRALQQAEADYLPIKEVKDEEGTRHFLKRGERR